MTDERERLQGLTQTHVVGEDAAELVAPEEAQPVESFALVGAQLRGQGRGRLGVGELVERQQARDLPLPRPCLALDDAECGQLLPQPRLEAADPQRAARPVLESSRLVDECAQGLQLALLQGEVRPVGQ